MAEASEVRQLAGFAAAKEGDGFVLHIIDDANEVFEIRASRENLDLILTNLRNLLAGGSGEDAHAHG